jgi:hypothetical protein
MKLLSPVVLGLSIAVAGSMMTAAQDAPSSYKVLQVVREDTKPYKGGAAHNKTESAFVAAMTKAKFPVHYIGLNSMSGKERSLYLTIYDSFADWEKSNKMVDKDPALSAELERAASADGELLEQVETAIYTTDSDLSYKSRPDLTHARYVEMTVFHVRGGHRGDWVKIVNMVKAANEKGGTSSHWTMYDVAYGANDGTYMALSADDSLADIDKAFTEDKKFTDAMGADGMKQLRELMAATVDMSYSQLFSINPKQSYPQEEWVKGDPDFWKPKTAAPKPAATTKPDAEKKP